jgi:hypothetical protein
MTRYKVCGPGPEGISPILVIKWVCTILYGFYIDFRPAIGDIWPFLGDIGPFLKPDIGGKLGDGYQL